MDCRAHTHAPTLGACSRASPSGKRPSRTNQRVLPLKTHKWLKFCICTLASTSVAQILKVHVQPAAELTVDHL
jgi:hypothetical protein